MRPPQTERLSAPRISIHLTHTLPLIMSPTNTYNAILPIQLLPTSRTRIFLLEPLPRTRRAEIMAADDSRWLGDLLIADGALIWLEAVEEIFLRW